MTALLRLRKEAGISAKELSMRTGIPFELVVKAELGIIELRPQQATKIMSALNHKTSRK
ncbi:MAG: helix-turn-helix transcriptional regulator [Firmicutes bacterium]|nr:helix-turn-helix transcriptional regulator [Bacillota bacterium]